MIRIIIDMRVQYEVIHENAKLRVHFKYQLRRCLFYR